jgi:hypothetical protein
LNLSVNLPASVPLWNEGANQPLAAGHAAELASLIEVQSLVTGPDAASGAAPARVPDSDSAAAQGQVSAQASAPGLPVSPAGAIAAHALAGKAGLALPEDWFESSVPVKNIAAPGMIEAGGSTQLSHPGLNLGPRLDATRLNQGLLAGAIDPGRQLRSNQVEFEAVPVQVLSREVTTGALAAHAAAGWYRPEGPRIQPGDQLMNEIPLLFAPIPVEPQQASIQMRFNAVLIRGLLMLGAVLAALLVVTPNLIDLPIVELMERAAAVLAVLGVLFLIFRRSKLRQE